MLDISTILRGKEAFHVRVLVSQFDQLELCGDDLAADAADDGIEACVSISDVVGECDVADDDLDVFGFETVDEIGFGEDGVGGGEESDAVKVLSRGDDGIADVFAYQTGAADYEDVVRGRHGECRCR